MTKWEDVRQTVANELSSISGKPIEQVPLAVWIRKAPEDVENEISSNKDFNEESLKKYLKTNPAAKLFDFHEGALRGREKPGNEPEITQTFIHNVKLRALEGIRTDWVRKWVREWLR